MNKEIVFDMDGTLADFYGVPQWIDYLNNHDATPYSTAEPLVDIEKFNQELKRLQAGGWVIVITSWLSKTSTPEFDKTTRAAKRDWLEKYGIPYDEIHLVKYGTPKQKCSKADFQVLFDDNERVRKSFGRIWNRIAIDPNRNDIIECLQKLPI